ncbi:MAG: nucleotidyltransferase family protein [Acidobacteriota bacterium]|nr:nucleotidyltransferase family protein [Acidobacteriota bacterium]
MSAGLRPEHRLLLACVGVPLKPDGRPQIGTLLQGTLDWQLVFENARAQRVAALCYPVLQELGGAVVPAEVLAAFRAEAMATAARNLQLAAKLVEITGCAEAEKIPLIPYKGAVLAEMAYESLGLRQFVDLDFILPHRDLRAAWSLLEALGYRPVSPALAAPNAPVPGEYVFLSREGVQIEVHTELTLRHFPEPPDLEPLLAEREEVTLAGRRVLTFSREDTLTLLAVHGAKDFWAQLLWICDIARLVTARGFDWGKALNRADQTSCRRMTNVALFLAHETLGATTPENVLRAVAADAGARELAQWLATRLFASEALGRREQLRYRMRMVEGFWPGVRYVARLATTPAADDWDKLRLPAPLGFAYFLLRPVRLLGRRKG